MMEENAVISSLQNPQVKCWRALNKSRADRLAHGLFLAEGEHMATEAVKEQKAAALLVDSAAKEKYAALLSSSGLPCHVLASHVMAAVCDAKTPQGIAALCPYPSPAALDALGDRIVALNAVQDPGNVGTILRTMDAAGFTGLLLDEQTADPYAPKTLRASMGAVFRVPTLRCDALPDMLDALRKNGYAVLAGDLKGEPFYQRPPVGKKVCLMIGNEGAGLSPEVLEKATLRLRIPIVGGAESLNAAVAAAVMMYDLLRERLGK